MLQTISEPVTSAGSPIETGQPLGHGADGARFVDQHQTGACVARARLQARFGSPMPTKTTSPSRSSRAATRGHHLGARGA